jgi:O-antigen ligase
VATESALSAQGEEIESSEDEESRGATGQLGATFVGCALASGFSLARLIEADPAGKLVSLVVLAMLVAGAWCVVSRPNLAVVVLVAYLPFSMLYPFPILGVSGLNGSNLALILGISAWVASSFGRERRPLGAFEYMIVAYLVLGALGAIRGQLRLGGIDVVDLLMDYRWWAAPTLLFFVARGTIEDEGDANAVLATLAYATFLIGALTWMEGVQMRGGRSIEDERVPGVLGQPNTMGAFLAYYGSVLLALAVAKGRLVTRALCLFAFLVVGRAIIFTFSRGALLALLAGSGAVVGMVNPLGVGVVGAGGLLARSYPQLLPDAVRDRFGQTGTDGRMVGEDVEGQLDKSSAERLNLWRGGFAMIGQEPIVGMGLKTFARLSDVYAPDPVEEGGARDAHNAYILTAAELGLPALFLMLAMLIGIGLAALGSWWRGRGPGERRLALGCLGCLAAVMVSCLFGSRFSEDALIGGFWLLAGTLWAVRMRDDDADEDEDEDPDGPGRGQDDWEDDE